ncbi:MAG: alkaline phosphatase family protein, partial [Bdellovibrio sp.]|nr:alkaline phosphatase family protein [Bdellovibrio sp.]
MSINIKYINDFNMLYKEQKTSIIAIFSLFFVIFSSCSNRYLLSRDYGAELRETPRNLNQNQTTILFLIDGLSVPVFQNSLVHNNIAETQRFFSSPNGKMLLGKAVFPTLTYPNITSILTAQPIHKHPIIGNKLYEKGQIINFEKPLNTQLLNRTLIGQTIFSRLAENYLKSVSLSHSFSSGANIGLGIDIEAGIAYLKEDFAKVDQKIIASLESLLTETEPTLWPHFIFVHLIGVDALSHKYGPYSPQAMQYLNQLDKELGRIYKILARTEQRGKKITSLLTSDHGFSEIKKFADLETFINKL